MGIGEDAEGQNFAPPAKPCLYRRLNPVNHHWIEHFWIDQPGEYVRVVVRLFQSVVLFVDAEHCHEVKHRALERFVIHFVEDE